MKKRLKRWIPIFLVLGLAFGLRVYHLANNPPALNWDEVSHGYNAYSLLKTGKDEWGRQWPLILRAYGDYKLPLYAYFTILPVSLLGVNAVAVRIVSALAGVGLVWIAYLLSMALWQEQRWALLAALFTAISPWGLFASRAALEANLAAFFFALGFWLYFKKYDWGALLAFGLAMETYNAARVIVPLMFLYWLVDRLKKKGWLAALKLGLPMALVAAPLFFQVLNSTGEARFFWTTPLDQGAINRIEEQRHQSSYSLLITRLLYNRPLYFLKYVSRNYPQHFGLNFLFIQGGKNYQFSLPSHGLLFLITAPFFFLGILIFARRRRWTWLLWLLVAFLPSAVTRDSPHALRSLLILPLPMILIASGLRGTKFWLREKSRFGGALVLVIVTIGALVQFGFWWRDYWRVYRPSYSWAWQYGYKQAVAYAKDYYGDYQKIVFTKKYGEPHEFVLFYWPWQPNYYQHDIHKKWNYHAHWYWVDAFDKFEFWNDWEVKEKLKRDDGKKILLITSPGNWLPGGRLVKKIDFLDGSRAFDVVSY